MIFPVFHVFLLRNIVSTQSSSTDDCPLDWESNGDYCYKAIEEIGTYDEARTGCLDLDATLASVENEEEQDFLTRKYTYAPFPVYNP